MLEKEPDFVVAGQARSAMEALDHVRVAAVAERRGAVNFRREAVRSRRLWLLHSQELQLAMAFRGHFVHNMHVQKPESCAAFEIGTLAILGSLCLPDPR